MTTFFGVDQLQSDEDKVESYLKALRNTIVEFNKFLADDSRIELVVLSIGDRVTLCRRLK
ncbi:flavonoid 3',5'-methyltransferase-like [Dorcoceras hygrometricum]|uniref:Flavonoid 3',5'-methyltransferase-like n=1 Tax=Dorcoceras hygrometricum TaxID=472368 RepID=A0A2Z7AVR6_9LAMI|nr:flavonoid 3',5'-methyltransferase-like [Dorcoceras hygrometricum]